MSVTKDFGKRIGRWLAACGAVLFLLSLTACDPQQGAAPSNPANVGSVSIPVEGMSCGACAARVRKTLADVAGVQSVEVNLLERKASIHFDSTRVSADELAKQINSLGYRAGVPSEAVK